MWSAISVVASLWRSCFWIPINLDHVLCILFQFGCNLLPKCCIGSRVVLREQNVPARSRPDTMCDPTASFWTLSAASVSQWSCHAAPYTIVSPHSEYCSISSAYWERVCRGLWFLRRIDTVTSPCNLASGRSCSSTNPIPCDMSTVIRETCFALTLSCCHMKIMLLNPQDLGQFCMRIVLFRTRSMTSVRHLSSHALPSQSCFWMLATWYQFGCLLCHFGCDH